MARQPASIAEVAKRAGVSVASASRVLSSSTYPVSAETREKVLKAAGELSYTPNSLARSLRAQRSNLIAVLVGDNADPYFAEIMRGVEDVANESGYLTIVCNSDRTPTKELHYLHVLQDYRIDGVIFAGSALNGSGYSEQLEQAVQVMMDRGAAAVTLSQHTLHVPSVQADNFGGAWPMYVFKAIWQPLPKPGYQLTLPSCCPGTSTGRVASTLCAPWRTWQLNFARLPFLLPTMRLPSEC